MKIKAKTPTGRVVTIISFVVQHEHTYAVVVDVQGILRTFHIEDLKVLQGEV